MLFITLFYIILSRAKVNSPSIMNFESSKKILAKAICYLSPPKSVIPFSPIADRNFLAG